MKRFHVERKLGITRQRLKYAMKGIPTRQWLVGKDEIAFSVLEKYADLAGRVLDSIGVSWS